MTLENKEWIEKRQFTKKSRRNSTDSIKEFIEYAKQQGSKGADKYYMIISNMQNKTLVGIDPKEKKKCSIRDVIPKSDLTILEMSDEVISNTIREGINKQMFYKDIYVQAKNKIQSLAVIMGKKI